MTIMPFQLIIYKNKKAITVCVRIIINLACVFCGRLEVGAQELKPQNMDAKKPVALVV